MPSHPDPTTDALVEDADEQEPGASGAGVPADVDPADADAVDDAASVPADGASDATAASDATNGGTATGQRFVFLDCEATGLDHTRHELTEVSWIVRFEDGSQQSRTYFPEHTLAAAEEEALKITHYHERIAPQQTTPMEEWLGQFLEDADGAVLVGAVPDFDAKHMELACRRLGLEPTWDHHLLDVETLALPFIAPGPERPRSLAKTCRALGIEHDRDQAHGALYDAEQAMRVFDAVWELTQQLRDSGDPFPPPVPRPTRGGDGSGDAPADEPAPSADAATA